MTKSEIITAAQLYLDDMSELSTQEFSDLFDRKLRYLNTLKPWEYTKREGTGNTSTSLPYIALASDFLYLTQNANYTDSSYEAGRPVVYVGTTYTPYKVISWSDRRSYRNTEGYAYIDYVNLRLYFTNQPLSVKAVEYDYHAELAAIANGSEPPFPDSFHPALFHLMVVDDLIIQQSDKAKSYAMENMQKFDEYYQSMCLWNANLVQL